MLNVKSRRIPLGFDGSLRGAFGQSKQQKEVAHNSLPSQGGYPGGCLAAVRSYLAFASCFSVLIKTDGKSWSFRLPADLERREFEAVLK
jgi:hypothetical protein